ncbi:MAG TPA: AgmX/PglI C-terminal domain-containing protein [Steroidobacteraceae bacterium]|nr:AgmX/PglI C-terminal domain-containing protein [Steroidobacteraceae bacterium]
MATPVKASRPVQRTAVSAAQAAGMVLGPHYRSYGLPWEIDPQEQQRLRRLLAWGLGVIVLLGLVLPLIHLPPITEATTEVPDRLARLMVQQQVKPPPPVVQPKPKPKAQTKPVPKPVAKPVEAPKPVDRAAQARRRAQNEINKIQDDLADIRQQMDPSTLGQTKNLQGAVGADVHADRSLIASNANAGSGAYVTTASASAGFGSGAGSLHGHQAEQVTSRISQAAATADRVSRGTSGRASRPDEEIEKVLDQYKGAIYALYERVLRQQPDLQGKLVLQFTIAPDGEVTECHVVSSELHSPDLERLIVARIKLIRFDAMNVAAMTTTKPIEFVPTS